MPSNVAVIIGSSLALAATVVLFILVLPENKRDRLPGFFKVISDILNVKFLIIEKILKFIYTFNTIACIAIGFFLLMSVDYISVWGIRVSETSLAPVGLLFIFIGPIFCRLVHECVMLFVLLVKNTMEINQKLKKQDDTENNALSAFDFPYSFKRGENPAPTPTRGYPYPPQPGQPVPPNYGQPVPPNYGQPNYGQPAAPAPTPAPASGEAPVMGPRQRVCKVCGNQLKENDRFCLNCGTRADD